MQVCTSNLLVERNPCFPDLAFFLHSSATLLVRSGHPGVFVWMWEGVQYVQKKDLVQGGSPEHLNNLMSLHIA